MSNFLILCCFVLLTMFVGCGRTPITPPIPTSSTRQAASTRRLAPFFVDDVDKITEEFKVVNRTGVPQQFVNILKSCTCTEAQLEKDFLLPDESTVLTLVVRPSGRSGKNSVVCGLVDQNGAKSEYSVSFDGYRRVTFSRPELTFGRVAAGEEQSLPFQVMAYSISKALPPASVDISVDDSAIQIERLGEELLTLDGGASVRRFSARVLLSSAMTLRGGNSTIRAIVRSDDKSHVASCPVSWTVSSPFHMTPSRLFIPSLERQNVYRDQLMVRRTDSQPFRILTVATSDPAIKAERILDTDDQIESVSISVAEADLKKSISVGSIVVTTDSAEPHSSFEIPFAIRRKD